MARRPPGRRNAATRWLIGTLVAVLVIVTIVLAVLAVQRTRSAPGDLSGTSAMPTLPATPTATPAPQPVPPAPTPEPTKSSAPTADRAGERFLAAGSETLWRATAGQCGGPAPLIERSDDAGETWVDVTPAYRQIAQVTSLTSFAGTEAQTIAAVSDACEVQALRTFTQGEFWAPYADVLLGSKYLRPGEAVVVTRTGDIEAPCAQPTGFRAAGDNVALICDGVAFRLRDGQWVQIPVQNVVALSLVDADVLTASAGEGCSGAALTRWSGSRAPVGAPIGCAPEVDLSTPIAMTAVGNGALLWTGENLLTVP